MCCFFELYGDHRDLHVLTHSCPTRRSSDLFRKVIDVSGDAGQRGGMPLPLARELAVSAGIVINGLALHYRSGGMTGPRGEALVDHFRQDVIGGMGAFAIAVEQENALVDALIRKLILEIAWVERSEEHTS